MDPGALFWKDFEDRVIKYVLDERRTLAQVEREAEMYKKLYTKQRQVLIRAAENDVVEDLTMCEDCKDFFIADDTTFECKCGTKFCNEDDCTPLICDRCDELYGICCIMYCECEKCEERKCYECVGDNFIYKEMDGYALTFCSANCWNNYKPNQ